jgi:lysozyme
MMRNLVLFTLVLLTSLLFACSQPASVEEETTTAEKSDTETNSATADAPAIQEKVVPDITPAAHDVHLGKQIKSNPKHVYGIDVSHHQGAINWQTLKELGVDFVYIKATEGIDYVDPAFEKNWQGARAAGVLTGAYHMFRPEDTAVEQASNFIRALESVGYSASDLPPVLDIESVHTIKDLPHKELHDRAVNYLKLIEESLGRKAVVYTNPRFWQDYLSDVHEIVKYPLWVAEYELGASEPSSTAGWKDYHFWQFSQYGVVDGVEKKVDLNRFNGEKADLLTMISKSLEAF